ncbi:MAG: GTP diphosphokinase [Gammaproteobacteria bacterium]
MQDTTEKEIIVREADTPDFDAWLAPIAKGKPSNEVDILRRACAVAYRAHLRQTRASGEPYVRHSLAVAEILADLRMDYETLAAAILHDVAEDTEITLQDLEKEFSPAIAKLVDGVTKLRVLREFQGPGDKSRKEKAQAESLRKMLLAMAEDVRVVLIKLADRLHNMRTLMYLDEERRRRIAQETLDIFAPLANRLGIWQIKWELEDLAFRYLEPATYRQIATWLDERRVDRERYIAQVVKKLKCELDKAGIEAEVTGRPKHIYSIWRKMKRKRLDFHQVFDVRAVRVLVKDVADCYAALGIVHTLWHHVPGEFDDYIATPKENLYRSLHTAVIGPQGKTVEVQIRTHEMHQHAEFGVAAHWRYKEGARYDAGFEQKIAWMRQLLEWKEEESDARDFIDRFKAEVFEDRVYVLTPRGQVVDLPQGATPLDFAYYIHTDVGHRCRGAKVNGSIVPLTYELKSGEQVEILTARNGGPSRDWLNPHLGYLKTSRARSKARQWFKLQDYEKNISAGRAALDRELRRLGITELSLEKLAQWFHYQKLDDFLAAVGHGAVLPAQIAAAAHALVTPAVPLEKPAPSTKPAREGAGPGEVHIQGVGNLFCHMAQCCKPVPEDAIIGYITRGRGVTIHRRGCPNVLRLDGENRARLIEVSWSSKTENAYPVDVQVEAFDRPGLLRDITSILANEKINVLALTTSTDKDALTARIDLSIEITDIGQLSRVLDRIAQLPNVREARRKVA